MGFAERFGSGNGEVKTMKTKQNVNEPLPASDLFGALRLFLEKHRADEKEWDAVDRLQEWFETTNTQIARMRAAIKKYE